MALCFASCKKDEVDAKQSNTTSVQTVVTGVNGPTKGLVNQILTYTLLWPNDNSQTSFHHLTAAAISDTSRVVKLFVAADTTATHATSAVLTFKAPAAGTYYLKFAKPNSDSTYSIIDTVVIK